MTELVTADACALHLAPRVPATAPLRGQVLIVHGLGEHSGRYAHVARHLAGCGFDVMAYDHRGHGRSQGPRGVIPTADSLLADLGAVLAQVRAGQPGVPLLLLGHSLGGLVAGRFVAEGLARRPAPWWQAVDALVMSSPALDLGMNLAQKALLAVLGPIAPGLGVANGLKPDWICRDAAVVRAYQADPLVHGRIAPRLVRFMLDAGAQVRACAAQWATPTCLLYAGADRCVAPRGSAAFAAAAPAARVQATAYPGLAHEIFNEPEQARVLADLTTWLQARFAPLPGGRPAVSPTVSTSVVSAQAAS
ncbi:alpha/beta hydrolase [Aquabacterium sp. OR-4]|uniref:alpha/beta hydrolase n=1 Tax=Aquabacterium sp. OR-4 TaxID=2978127 RepID=UPI0028C586DF|nr:lysophospholipase [Aquabacterium sp. OR-4]MDT7833863.1 alpha/beta hydrolase [Aquabacterium sp. OR-4]